MPYLFDGNNLMGSWGKAKGGGDRRPEVIRRVARFCRLRGARATVVFDGRPSRADVSEQHLGAISIRFPPAGQDADSVIRSLVEEARHPGDLIVVTSDKPLYSYVRGLGAQILRAHEWNAMERRVSAGAESSAGEKPDREDDVEGWLKRFGG